MADAADYPRRLVRLIVSAYSCMPGWGSEPGIGWGVTDALARAGHEVSLLTTPEAQRVFEDPRNHVDHDNLHVEYVVPQPLRDRDPSSRLRYLAWQIAAARRAAELHQRCSFEVALHLTDGASWLPTFLGRTLDIPVVWHTGSAATTPWRLVPNMGRRAAAAEASRNMLVRGGQRLARAASGSPADVICVDQPPFPHPGSRTHRMVLGGMHPWELARLAGIPVERNGPFRVLMIGRLLGWKGFHLGIDAFARVRAAHAPDATLVVVGTGPMESQLARRAKDLGISDAVDMRGGVGREDVFDEFAGAHVLLHPSLHEQVGYVVLEAMSAAVPVVCVDAAGPPVIVGDTGRVVGLETPEATIDGLADALGELAADEALRMRLGLAARQRVADHWSWARVGADVSRVLELATSP